MSPRPRPSWAQKNTAVPDVISARLPTQTGSANLILRALPAEEYRRVSVHLQPVRLNLREALCEANKRMKFGYFPSAGIVCCLVVMQDGKSVEVGITGKEGFLGASLLLGTSISPTRVIVQLEGGGFRIGADTLRELVAKCPTLNSLLRRILEAELAQGKQFAACNSLHTVCQRLARWLLMMQDRTDTEVLPLTQDLLCEMIGCGRISMMKAAANLRKKHCITYRRGRLRILNRRALERQTCECYAVARRYFDMLSRFRTVS